MARLGLDKSTVSRQVASLVDLGLVDRERRTPTTAARRCSRRRREGAARLAQIRDARRERWEADLGDWPAEDVATLAELLHRLNRIGEAHARGGRRGAGPG